jgi:hypothetical protein
VLVGLGFANFGYATSGQGDGAALAGIGSLLLGTILVLRGLINGWRLRTTDR